MMSNSGETKPTALSIVENHDMFGCMDALDSQPVGLELILEKLIESIIQVHKVLSRQYYQVIIFK